MLLTWKTAKRQKKRNRRSGCRKALASHTSSLTALTTARQLSYVPLRQENCHPPRRLCTVAYERYMRLVMFVSVAFCTCRRFIMLARDLISSQYTVSQTRRLAIAKRPCDCCIILKSGSYTKAT